MTKEEIRNQKLSIRRALSINEVIDYSINIATKLFDTPEFQDANIIHIYKSTPVEVSTIEIINKCFELNKRVIVPVTNSNWNYTDHVEIFPDTVFEKLYFGILTPIENCKKFDIQLMSKNDLFVVPIVAFDSKLNRIGYGKGCYDSFLKGAKGIRIAIAFSCQKTKLIIKEKHDVRLHKVICEL